MVALALMCLGCGLSAEQAEIAETLETTIGALETGNLEQLWDVSAPEAREQLLELHSNIRRAMEVIDVVYPESERAAARKSVGGDFIGAVQSDGIPAGARLLSALIQPDALRMDQAARDGLRNKGADIEGDRATIKTTAGESFTFQRTEEGWRSALIIDILQRSKAFRAIEENVENVVKLADGKRRLWIESTDPTTPNGAFNLLRQALSASPVKHREVFTLLDKPSRMVFVQGLEVARDIQKKVRRGVSRNKRNALYAKHGIGNHVKMQTDLEFFKSWSASPDFNRLELPSGSPSKIDGDIQAGLVTVITDDGGRASFVREQDGFWHWTDSVEVLRKSALEPLTSKLAALKKRD